jgi:hypothetical protein
MKYVGVDCEILLKRILKRQWEIMDWIHVAKFGDIWQVLVNGVMKHMFP